MVTLSPHLLTQGCHQTFSTDHSIDTKTDPYKETYLEISLNSAEKELNHFTSDILAYRVQIISQYIVVELFTLPPIQQSPGGTCSRTTIRHQVLNAWNCGRHIRKCEEGHQITTVHGRAGDDEEPPKTHQKSSRVSIRQIAHTWSKSLEDLIIYLSRLYKTIFKDLDQRWWLPTWIFKKIKLSVSYLNLFAQRP